MHRYFLLDASVLIPFLLTTKAGDEPVKRAVTKLLKLRAEGRATLRVPNFCMAECSKGIASVLFEKVHYPSKAFDQARSKHSQLIETLLEIVSKKRQGVIQSYALARRHMVGVEEILEAQFELNPRGGTGLLSGLDALVISMGRTLAQTYGRDRVFIVTADEWMATVCERSSAPFPRAIYAIKEPVPDG